MQDVQNIPNPDVDSFEHEGDLGSHSDVEPNSRTDENSQDVERPSADIPVPPDSEPNARIEEPPDTQRRPSINEDNTEPKRLV